MYSSLDAHNFVGATVFYDTEFETILEKVVSCCKMLLNSNAKLENDENKIRDTLLLKYLKNNQIRNKIGLTNWHFEREVPEDTTIGRTDIKVISPQIFTDQEAYYIIECKRLNNQNTSGTSGLNGEYIKNGIKRFTSKYYSSYYRVNGMIGFIVEELNIGENIELINTLLSNSFLDIETKQGITNYQFIEDFEHLYYSTHFDSEKAELKIYHLMFDFRSLIN